VTTSSQGRKRDGARLGQRAVTAITAGALVVTLAVLALVWSTPYVVWSAGARVDAMADAGTGAGVTIKGPTTYPVGGTLLLGSVDRNAPRTGVVGLLANFLRGATDVFPNNVAPAAVPAVGQDLGETQLAVWQRNAVVAALRAAGLPTAQAPIVSSVVVGGPAYRVLRVNDIVTAVDGVKVSTVADVRSAIAKRAPTETIQFDITRGDTKRTGLQVVATAANDDTRTTVVGASFANSFTYEPEVRFNLAPAVNNASSGLMMALGLYDILTSENLLQGRTVAGVGAVDPTGAVSIDPVAGVRERAGAAAAAGAQIFFIPETTGCQIVSAFSGGMAVVKVASLSDTILALRELALDPRSPAVSRC